MAESTPNGEREAPQSLTRGDHPLANVDDANVIVVSNRQPYRHEWDGKEVNVGQPTGGLSQGLDSAVRKIDGTWIAWGDGDADAQVVDGDDCVTVPPDADADEQYVLKRIWLSEEQVENYYYGFSNRVLWPVCHSMLTHVHSTSQYWETYTEVNEQFADAVAARASSGDVVWIQDYQLARTPQMVHSRVPDDVTVAHFWHIPWPGWDTFRACPHREELLRGVLGNDLLAVHLPRYRENFLRCVDAALPEVRIDWRRGRVFHRDGTTTVDAFPLGVDTAHIRRLASGSRADDEWAKFAGRHGLGDRHVAVSVDRLDYTKGIPTRLAAFERLWETYPELRGDLTFVQIGTESRSKIPAYRELQANIEDTVERINDRFATDRWQPIVYTTRRLSNTELYSLYRHADIGVVTPIRDGMNLVAQEFVASQGDDPGVLVLSDQAGVHDLVGDAVVTVSPQDADDVSRGVETALSMPRAERTHRMRSLSRKTRELDVSAWIDDLLERVTQVREGGERRAGNV